MEPASEGRFDANFAARILLELAHEQSLEKLLEKLIQRAMERPHIACAQVWLIEKGDLCASCPRRPVCPNQSRCLHLAAAKGNSILERGKGFGQFDSRTVREPLGVPPIGNVVVSGETRAVADLDKRPPSPLDPDWMRDEGIRGYTVNPISYQGEPLGAIVSATREQLEQQLLPWGAILANHIGAAIANARAFDEIRVAGKRLEEANRSLERELAERKTAEERLRQSEQRYRRLVDTASEGIWELDEHYTTTYVNRRMAEMLGYEPQELVGKHVSEFLFEDDAALLPSRIAARRQGFTERYEQRYRHKDGRTLWMQVSATSVRDAEHRFLGSFAMLTDIVERKRAEEALHRLNRELRAITTCNQVLLRATDEQSLLREVCRIVCEEAGYGAAWVGYAEHDAAKSVRPVAWTGLDEGSLRRFGVTWADTERGQGPCGIAIRTGKTSFIEDYAADARVAPWRESAAQHGFRSAIALPLKDEQANTFAGLTILSAQPSAFSGEEIRLLEQLAADLAFGIVTLRSRAARERAEQEVALLSFALEKGREAACLIDEQARFHYVNEEACRLLGYTRAELLGLGVAEIDPEFPLERWPDHWRELKARRSMTFESRHRTREGRMLPVEVSANYFEYGGHAYNLALVRDITERKRSEEALRRSEVYLAEGQRLSHTGSWAWSPLTLQSLYWSEEMCRIYGFDPRDGVPRAEAFWQRIHPEDLDCVRAMLMEAAKRSMDYEHDHRIVLPDGTLKHIHAIGHPVHDESGRLVEYVGTAVDVTERKLAEEELRKHRDHLEELVKQRTEELALLNQLVYGSLESGEVGAWWIDFKEPDTYHALDNAVRMLGLEPDPTGKKTYKLSEWRRMLAETAVAFPEYAPIIEQTREGFAGAISGEYAKYRAVYPVALPDGSLKWMEARAEIAKRDEHGQALFMTGTIIDITRLKRAEAELEEAKARAEAANREKSRFLANMSHELRTPLNAVLGFSRLLKNGSDATPQQQETLDIVVRSGEHLLNLINNVLDMAKIESGRMALEESEIDLHQLLHEVQSLMGVGAAEKGLHFGLEPAADLPRFVGVDAGKLRQVLLNLIGNAIKYTDSGGVKLRARLADRVGQAFQPAGARGFPAPCAAPGDSKVALTGRLESLPYKTVQVRFEVEDSGPGIKQEDAERIFLPFVQLGEQSPAQAGTGLGLAICKQYVELMHGEIGVVSELGKGSVFQFTIPVTVLPSVAEPAEENRHRRVVGLAEGQPPCRLLIAEDQQDNRLLLRRLLSPLGFELREASNGQEAVAVFEQWHPALIWMDIRMPVMDGLEAVRRIRASQAGAETKIIALTAHALEEERGPIMAAGCDDLVRKPFREQELFDAMARHLGLKFIYDNAPGHQGGEDAPGLQVGPEQFEGLPAELLRELRQAVIELDTARTQALIEQVSARDASLGRALNTLAAQLDYKRLLKLIERGHSQAG